jgi:hypothetical protein
MSQMSECPTMEHVSNACSRPEVHPLAGTHGPARRGRTWARTTHRLWITCGGIRAGQGSRPTPAVGACPAMPQYWTHVPPPPGKAGHMVMIIIPNKHSRLRIPGGVPGATMVDTPRGTGRATTTHMHLPGRRRLLRRVNHRLTRPLFTFIYVYIYISP